MGTFKGETLFFTASAAAVPAACPSAVQQGLTLSDAFASNVDDTSLPAAMILDTLSFIKHR